MSFSESFPPIALAGSPNCGKTALFNAITGGRQKVANYPGVTVEKIEGSVTTQSGRKLRVIDLPGSYTLEAKTLDEEVLRDVVLGRVGNELEPAVIVAVADATNLERTLGLALELRDLGKHVVLVLNMMDLARNRGLVLDLKLLSQGLRIPIVATVATKNEGIPELLKIVEDMIDDTRIASGQKQNEPITWKPASAQEIKQRYAEIDRALKVSVKRKTGPSLWTERLDKIVLHSVFGPVILFSVLVLMFQAVFSWAEAPMGLVEAGISAISSWVSAVLPQGLMQSLIVDGIIAGVGSVVIFLPQILILFFFILLLEDLGYMARAAFLMDRLMGKVGLHGRAFIPLLSSFACAIPGIMATRTIENKRDRLATIMVAPLMTCSARLPVYTLLIAAFIPNQMVLGGLNLQGVVMMGLYLTAVVSALVVAWVLKRTTLRGPTPHLLIELPTYKLPSFRNLLIGLQGRAIVFLRRAGTVILALSVILWFLATFPSPPEGATGSAIEHSYAGKIGKFLEPVFAPIGFNWKISVALIPGFAAREVMVGALGTVYALEGSEDEVQASLTSAIQSEWTLATALSLLAWYIFAPQCLSTLAVVRRETNSGKWAVAMFIYMTVLAYLVSLLVYRLAL